MYANEISFARGLNGSLSAFEITAVPYLIWEF